MMATPSDLEDYALGFCLSEQLISSSTEMAWAVATPVEAGGWVLRIQMNSDSAAPLIERVRLRLAEGSCGLCGIESLEQVMRPLPPVRSTLELQSEAIFRATSSLSDQQVLGKVTRAAHAAALCTPDGEIVLVREDIGRHNALDKLFGAAAREGFAVPNHFVVLTARCSYELVQKAVVAQCPVLVTISAASAMAEQQAKKSNLRLISLARSDSYLSHQIAL